MASKDKAKAKAKAPREAEAKAKAKAVASPSPSQLSHEANNCDKLPELPQAPPVPPVRFAGLPPHTRVLKCAPAWSQLGDRYVAQVADQGLKLDWIDGFDPYNISEAFRPKWCVTQPRLAAQAENTIKQWLLEGIITEIDAGEAKSCSSIFTIPKRNSDEVRLITNLKNVNAFLKTTYFKLPTLQKIAPLLQTNMWATSIDLKSAYHHWPIHPRDKPFLVFEFFGRFYQHQSLPFGLSVAPREWQRAMEAVVTCMRAQGAFIWVYLDDFLLVGNSPQEVYKHTQTLLQLLANLGV
jgi:hypothetical protein